ncbi:MULTISPECIES: hypothetical protein [unclassified Pseudofrankia]|uniref:hypothetical protein n=1 Tax=unclassified Pseudofrankia TaxID=2994372 RepID=UPI0008D93D86|nr:MULTISPECIES: hypothetical protein [unclassified Pseudofrankia]MDT3442356.1 hypothetical protein [Pseudofrankia sp. BMG5.37]OHV47861.1 hypothetical protein BCD48_17040 [Pseudofrankia sp. BMG5.36]
MLVLAAAARDEVPRAAGRAAAERVAAERAPVERVAVGRAAVERVAGDAAVRVVLAGLLPSGLAVVVRAFDGMVVPLSAQAAATVDYA